MSIDKHSVVSNFLTVDATLEHETPGYFKSLEQALVHAKDGDRIFLIEGDHYCSQLIFNKTVSLTSNHQKNTKIFADSLVFRGSTRTTLRLVSIFITSERGITIERGNHHFESCMISFLAPNSNLRILKTAQAQLIENRFVRVQGQQESLDCTVFVEGQAELIRNVFIGNSIGAAIGIHNAKGEILVKGNSIWKFDKGIVVSETLAIIDSNCIKLCEIGIMTCSEISGYVTNNTMEGIIFGIFIAEKPISLNIERNYFRAAVIAGIYIAVPIINGCSILDNTFRISKAFGVYANQNSKGLGKLQKNKFLDITLGEVQFKGNNEIIDTVASVSVALVRSKSVDSNTFPPEHTAKVLSAFPGIFSVAHQITFSDKVLDFSELETETSSHVIGKMTHGAQHKQKVIRVDPNLSQDATGESDFKSLETALDMANDNDIIKLAEGVHTFTQAIKISKSITIMGSTKDKSKLAVPKLILEGFDTMVVLQNLGIICSGEFQMDCGYCVMQDCHFVHMRGNRISVHTATVSLIQGNTFTVSREKPVEPSVRWETLLWLQVSAEVTENSFLSFGHTAINAWGSVTPSTSIIKRNSITSGYLGITILGGRSIIESNTISKCRIGICSRQAELVAEIQNNTLSTNIFGMELYAPSNRLDVINNKIEYVIVAAVFIRTGEFDDDRMTIKLKGNQMAHGKLVAVNLQLFKNMAKTIERENSFTNFAHGNVTGNMDSNIACLAAMSLCSQKQITPGHISAVISAHKILAALNQYPDLFSVSDGSIAFRNGFNEFVIPQVAPSAEQVNSERSENNNNASQRRDLESASKSQSRTEPAPSEATAQPQKNSSSATSRKKTKSKKQRLKEQKAKQQQQSIEGSPLPQESSEQNEQPEESESDDEEAVQTKHQAAAQVEAVEDDEDFVPVVAKQKKLPRAAPPPSKPKRQDWSKHARKIFDRTGGLCYLCRQPMKYENRHKGQPGAWHIEHVMPFSKYPELDVLANLLPAHIECDSCKGPSHLQSIVNEADFDLLTLNITSLHPEVAEELNKAKRLYQQQNAPRLPDLLNSTQFPRLNPVSPPPKPNQTKNTNQDVKENNNNVTPTINSEEKQSKSLDSQSDIKQFLIRWDDIKMTDERLGEGSFGTVWKAKWKGTPVAVKKLHNTSEDYIQEFQKEVSILGNLRHGHIILMYGACVPPDPCAIVTELFEKRSLQHVLDSKEPLDQSTKLRFALDIARGMCYLHTRKILHLDLKPLNIMVDNSGNCKIADFGLSKTLSLRSNGAHCASNQGITGTVAYMSPEVIAESPLVDFAADVYSYGIILWQIHTRVPPFQKMSVIAVITEVAMKKSRPPVPPDCLPVYGELMQKCWQHDPSTRPMFEPIIDVLESLIG